MCKRGISEFPDREEHTTQRLPLCRVLAWLLLGVAAHAGVLISRSGQGFQFTDAISVSINGKDKIQVLGDRPKASGPLSKLPSGRLAGTLVKDHDSGVFAQYDADQVEYLVPQGLPKGAPDDPAALWRSARITIKKTNADKAGTEVPPEAFLAFLPGGVEELARICTDPKVLAGLGGKDQAFATQIELMAAVVRAYAANPAVAPLERYVEDALRSRYQGFENGAGGIELLQQGLKFAELSQAVYPGSPEQEKLRRLLAERKAWLERRIAIMGAFTAAAQWDAYLLASRDFERYQAAFPETSKEHLQALQESLLAHSKAAAARKKDGDFAAAYREFRVASARKPSDAATREEAMQAWTEYSRRTAADTQSLRTRLSAGPQSTVERAIFFADQNRQGKKLDEALKNVQDAETVLKNSLPAGAFGTESLKVLYMKAEVLAAQERINEALAALDAYDLHAVDEERVSADKLRNQLLFSQSENLKTIKARLQTAWSEGNFEQSGQLAAMGLRMKGDDPELLYIAGLSAVVRRQAGEGREFLSRYLDASNTLDANPEDRAKVIRLLPALSAAPAASDGLANWLSGWKLPSGVFYCPISLAFQPGIERIEASGKLRETFEWEGERIKSVTPALEGGDRSSGERRISFAYDLKVPQVAWAADDDTARPPAPTGSDLQRSTLLLLNNPLLDPIAIQRVTGRNVAEGIAFNRFFNPFVWEKLYYFRLTYDPQGRVIGAQELSGPRGAPGAQTLEFEWNGMQLAAIRGFQGKTKNYERTMQYQGGRLVSEEIQGQGKPSRIKYTYTGNRLVSAETTNDATLDNRSRKVTFRSGSPSTLVK